MNDLYLKHKPGSEGFRMLQKINTHKILRYYIWPQCFFYLSLLHMIFNIL